MAGVSSVFVLLAELEDRYDLTAGLGWIAGSAFAALVTQLALARYADRGYGLLLLRVGVCGGCHGLLWFAAATELWQFVAAAPARRRRRTDHAAGPAGDRADVDRQPGERLGVFYAAYLAGLRVRSAGGRGAHGRWPTCACPSWCSACSSPPAAWRRIEMSSIRRRRRRRRWPRPTGGCCGVWSTRRVIAALLVVVSFRYSIGVFEPLWATYLDDLGASTMVVTLSLTVFALPMLVMAGRRGGCPTATARACVSVLSAAATVPLMASYGYVAVGCRS